MHSNLMQIFLFFLECDCEVTRLENYVVGRQRAEAENETLSVLIQGKNS